MDVPQVYIGFHNEMIRTRTTDRKKATEIAELLLECDNLPILLRASCHMIFARGRGAYGILDIGHARESYRLLEQFIYENAKVGSGVSEEEWKRQMNELHKMRRAIQERANEIREKELGRKRRNRKCYMSPKDLEDQAQAEDSSDLLKIHPTARISDPFLDEKQETGRESERSNTSSWNISPSRRNTPPCIQDPASDSPETPPPPYTPHANDSTLNPHRDSTSSLHLNSSSSPSTPSDPPSKRLPHPLIPSPSQRHALPPGLEIPPRTASLSPTKKKNDEETPEVRLSTFLQELEMQKHESSTGSIPNWV